jgi:protein-disulfide isomerase
MTLVLRNDFDRFGATERRLAPAEATVMNAPSFAAILSQPIPRGWDGFWLGKGGANVVHLEMFGDLVCPDTKLAHPMMKAVMAHYGDKLAYGLHRFPLPYHHNAFYAWQAGGVIDAMPPKAGVSRVWEWVDAWFGDTYPNQANFTNGATADFSANLVTAKLATMAYSTVGISAKDFTDGMAYDGVFDEANRASWKYGCSRGVSGTPTFMLNGVPIDADPAWKLSDWTKVIDPLL